MTASINNLTDYYLRDNSATGFLKNYCQYLSELMDNFDLFAVEQMVRMFLEARERYSSIFFAGNGGSAATASHFSQDLSAVGRKAGVKSFKALSLTDNISFISAVANDYGYHKIFTAQMEEFFQPEDLIVLISASGNSPNVVLAAEYAAELGGKSIGLVGFDGGKLAQICDLVIHIKTEKGEYGPVEDLQLVLDHMVTSYLSNHLQSP